MFTLTAVLSILIALLIASSLYREGEFLVETDLLSGELERVKEDNNAVTYVLDGFIESTTKATLKKLEKKGLINYLETKTGFTVFVPGSAIKYVFSNKNKKARVTKKTK